MIIKDFNIRISEDNVLDILGCTRDNDIYGEYLKGMLADAIADDYVFQIEHNLVDVLKDMCIQNHVGIIRRLEAPQDIGITM